MVALLVLDGYRWCSGPATWIPMVPLVVVLVASAWITTFFVAVQCCARIQLLLRQWWLEQTLIVNGFIAGDGYHTSPPADKFIPLVFAHVACKMAPSGYRFKFMLQWVYNIYQVCSVLLERT